MIHQTQLEFKEKLVPRKAGATKLIVVHHSEVSTPHGIKDVHRWHKNKGWAGVGYHIFITKDGEIWVGRPLDVVGAHAYGHNHESIGVCFEGDFNKEVMGKEQEDAGEYLLTLLGVAYPGARLCRHGELNSKKTCPGARFPFERLQQRVEQNLQSLGINHCQ